MAMLALYWSIMIACYLIAGKLRRHKDRFHFLDKLTSFFIYLLIFLMGRRMGADERHDTTTDEYHSSTGGSTAREHPRNDTVEV